MERNVLSSGIHHPSIPRSYSRPESELPRPSQVSDSEIVPVVPVIDSSSHGKPLNVQQVGQTSKSYSFFQVMDHGANSEAMKKISEVENEFFSLPVEEMTKPYSEDPSNTVRLSTSFNVNTEKVHKWRDYLRLHRYTLESRPLYPYLDGQEFVRSSQIPNGPSLFQVCCPLTAF
ncbi:hypothetical protein QN277_001118 [Acacia crassicarpa]|uniref:Non-haem dioxygenase N-terminal domain-containing protein n=1 Tax=Acacia crassicarpa TaxID=499986 RepID=A0AAE1N6Q0_9FABA|nr:hypothetical protein QN277_001118 [Acacia crassicarpa]